MCIAAMGACDGEPEASPFAGPQESGTAAAGAPHGTAPAPDWDAVVAADMDGEAYIISFSHLARYVDHWHGGAVPRVMLRCDAEGVVRDEHGNAASVGAPEWKALVTEAWEFSPTGVTAIQALPAASHDYRDGLGRVQRHAYFVEAGDDWSLTFVAQGPRDNPSGG